MVRPETIAPRIQREGLLEKVTTKCVPGAIPENSEVVLNCAQGGVWSAIAGSGCLCGPGLIKAGDGKSCIGKITFLIYQSSQFSICKMIADHTYQNYPPQLLKFLIISPSVVSHTTPLPKMGLIAVQQ